MQIRGAPGGSRLRAAPGFQGPALLVCRHASKIRISGVDFEGNRDESAVPGELPPYDTAFASFQTRNGILAVEVDDLLISDVVMRRISGFGVLISHASEVRLERIAIEDSGSYNRNHRNNTTGGILLEDGTRDFRIEGCNLRRIRGNGIWTHSRYGSPRNANGHISANRFEEIGRDAIQVGHATGIHVQQNTGTRIGYPVADVDAEGGGTPVAIDTAGNVDRSSYAENRFTEINGKCIDLDGFHHGEVVRNTCRNAGAASAYPFGHFGIVFNNTNPDMQSEAIRVGENTIDGARYGGIFLIGSGHTVEGNRLLNLNQAGCGPSRRTAPECSYWKEDPSLLETGIYLGSHAERPAVTRGNRIVSNRIEGTGMSGRCIAAAPGVDLKRQTISANRCSAAQPSAQ